MIRTLEETVLQNQWIIIDLLVIFAGIVFFGSILNASLVSLAERQREVATLRVLGYGPWEIGSLLFRESIITALIGTVLGMPLGYLITVVTAEAYASDMFRMPIITSPPILDLDLDLRPDFPAFNAFCRTTGHKPHGLAGCFKSARIK